MTSAPDELSQLVDRFNSQRHSYEDPSYLETQLRREFLDPFFSLLDWDMDNKSGYAEAYKDVIHEDSIKTREGTRAPDYCFRIGGTRKFFVEAKKPAERIDHDSRHSYQLRRYGWSAHLPLSILTNFEQFAVYDCRFDPKISDKASTGRVSLIRYEDYESRWDEIARLFSKGAVLRGAFDQYADSAQRKRGTQPVDKLFLSDIEAWRDVLARNIALRNLGIDEITLNYSVQSIIDRIVFLRIAEDRGIENYGRLRNIGSPGHHDAYKSLTVLFQQADDKYNSGLFHFKSSAGDSSGVDRITMKLVIDDKVIQPILRHLYYPDSPYEFSVMPAEILGQVYERFLGQVIRLTPGGRAVIEEKPEVRKAGGVYYTPSYIVEHIVDRTLKPLLDGKTPAGVAKLKILDPASGSGSFLLVAYERLLRWHLDYYTSEHNKRNQKRFYVGPYGQARLTVDEKKRILLNNIFGVDIDSQAVEVTKLSLLLKVLEGESDESLNKQLRLFSERALPDLDQNVRCGNSLIEPDFYESGGLFITPAERKHVNAFDWSQEFPDIMAKGGFDVVIGNPPYIFSRENFSSKERDYYATKYKAGWEKRNTYLLFMERLLHLLAPSGRGGFIVPNSWLTVESARRIREMYISHISEIDDLNYLVFDGPSVEPSIFIVTGRNNVADPVVVRARNRTELISTSPLPLPRSVWTQAAGRIVIPEASEEIALVERLLEHASPLGELFDVRTGLQAYEEGKGSPIQTKNMVKDHVFDRHEWEDNDSFRYLQGRDIHRYSLNWSGSWMQYGPWLSQPRTIDLFTRPRVLIREITSPLPYCLSCVFTGDDYLSNKSIITVLDLADDIDQLKLLEVVLNSRVTSLYYKARAVKSARRVFPKIVIRNLAEFPFPVEFDRKLGSSALATSEAVKQVIIQIAECEVPSQRESLQRELHRLEQRLELEVCRLFRLTPDDTDSVMKLTESPSETESQTI